jgi:quercetin dioxygenase-like cupin family protein
MLIRNVKITESGFPGMFAGSLATPRLGATEVTVIRQRQEPGTTLTLHYHHHEEVIVLLAGTITALVGDKRVEVAPGDTLIVPGQTLHQIENTSQDDAEWLLIGPSGMQFFLPNGEEVVTEWAK